MAEVFETVRRVAVDNLSVGEERVTEGAKFRADLEADSLDVVEFVMAVEDKLGITILEEDIQAAAKEESLPKGDMTFGRFCRLVEEAVALKSASAEASV